MAQLTKIFPTVLNMKNVPQFFFRNSMKNKMTYFNISVDVKRRRDKKRSI